MFKYYTQEELTSLLNQTVEFLVSDNEAPRTGVLVFQGRDYWLPYCGWVKATTVKIRAFV